MKRLALLLLLATPCFGAGPKYRHSPPKLNDEVENIYHDINSVLKGGIRISTIVGRMDQSLLARLSLAAGTLRASPPGTD